MNFFEKLKRKKEAKRKLDELKENVDLGSKKVRDYHFDELFNEGKVYWNLFGQDIEVLVEHTVSAKYVDDVITSFENMPEETIDDFAKAAIKYYKNVIVDYGITPEELDMPEKIEGREIFKYIYPVSIIINNPKGPGLGFHMEMNCEWEMEHGLELTILDNKILYVGPFYEEEPWHDLDYYKENDGNYVFK